MADTKVNDTKTPEQGDAVPVQTQQGSKGNAVPVQKQQGANFEIVCLCMMPILDFIEEYAKFVGEKESLKLIEEVRSNTPTQTCMGIKGPKHSYELGIILIRDATNYSFILQGKKVREDPKPKQAVIEQGFKLLNACQEMHLVFSNSKVGHAISASFGKGWDKMTFLEFDPKSQTIGIEGFPMRLGIEMRRMPAAHPETKAQ